MQSHCPMVLKKKPSHKSYVFRKTKCLIIFCQKCLKSSQRPFFHFLFSEVLLLMKHDPTQEYTSDHAISSLQSRLFMVFFAIRHFFESSFFHFKLRYYYILSNVRTWSYASFLTIIDGFILAIIKQKSIPFGWGTLDSWITEVEVNYICSCTISPVKFEERKSQSAHSKAVKPSLGRCASQHANMLIHSQPKKMQPPC